jgi:hypothetical protein
MDHYSWLKILSSILTTYFIESARDHGFQIGNAHFAWFGSTTSKSRLMPFFGRPKFQKVATLFSSDSGHIAAPPQIGARGWTISGLTNILLG